MMNRRKFIGIAAVSTVLATVGVSLPDKKEKFIGKYPMTPEEAFKTRLNVRISMGPEGSYTFNVFYDKDPEWLRGDIIRFQEGEMLAIVSKTGNVYEGVSLYEYRGEDGLKTINNNEKNIPQGSMFQEG